MIIVDIKFEEKDCDIDGAYSAILLILHDLGVRIRDIEERKEVLNITLWIKTRRRGGK
jgi:hypothetical protein